MAKIFVAQENNRVDYGPAEDFGELVFLTASEFRSTGASLKNHDVLAQVRHRFEKFNPVEDYLVFTGNPVMMGYVFRLAYNRAQEAGVPVRYLQWDRFMGGYRVGVFPVDIEESDDE